MPKRKTIPTFSDEDEERAFWEQVDVADFLEGPADNVLLDLKRKQVVKIVVRVSPEVAKSLKRLAQRRGVSLQTLAGEILAKGIKALSQ
ncbi:MAG: BrnA antitoxin family protein [Armatimonadetes bacterium]|nr:BrnA antitoxin family protein [Armatimonadota bacterium]